jgi:hypothetical protein
MDPLFTMIRISLIWSIHRAAACGSKTYWDRFAPPARWSILLTNHNLLFRIVIHYNWWASIITFRSHREILLSALRSLNLSQKL